MWKNKSSKLKITYVIAVLLIGMAFKSDDRLFEIAKNLEIFASVYKELNSQYVDEINPNKTMRIGIQAMLKDLDPYTNFYPEDEIEDAYTMNTGSFNGIGANIETSEGKHLIVSIYENSPADKVGMKIGDEITSINGFSVIGRTQAEFGRLLMGQKGTQVKLSIYRKGTDKKQDFNVGRDVVKTPTVPHTGILQGDIGYIQLTEFTATASKEVRSSILDLKEKGMKKLILDLRGNPGGLLIMAVEICNMFLPKDQLIVETKGKVKEWNQKFKTQYPPMDLEIPVAVLINGSSASASEIVSGTLQDYDRAVVIGGRSFGKGLVQITKSLPYNTQIKITTSKYYIPSGRCIQAIDYGKKDANGKAIKLPDSLRANFKTKIGRSVLDGAGIDPDIVTGKGELSEFTRSLVRQRVLFEFANQYYFKNLENKPKENFSLPSSDWEAFSDWFSNKNQSYKSTETKQLETLEKTSSLSPHTAKMKTHFDGLKQLAKENNQSLLQTHKAEIQNEIELEILTRYYYQKVMKFVALDKDPDVQKAVEVLNNSTLYKQILSKK
ncbi:MAG: S41 family peptidase [Leadbetterella sp.]